MVQSLTDEQKEQAANTSHAYFVLTMTSSSDDNNTDKHRQSKEDIQESMAMRMARRHLVAQKGNKTKAIEGMIETLRFRNEIGIDDLRRCMITMTPKDIDGHHGDDNDDTTDNNKLQRLREEVISGIEASDTVQLRGYDKEVRVLLVRKSSGTKPFDASTTDVDSFLKVQLYWVERAIACTERKSHGKQEKLNMCIDYNGYNRKNKPPISMLRALITTLQTHYPERLHYWIAIDPPFILNTIWKIVSFFVDPITKEKVKFVSGDEAKIEMIGPYIDIDQAMPFLLPGGKQTEPVNLRRMLYEIPFDHAYNE